MSDDTKRVVRRFIEEVVNTGDVDRLDELLAVDCREANDPTGRAVGLESMRAHVLGVRSTYPDLYLTVEQQIAEGEWVATRITARGTHAGWWMGIAPTGKPVEITGVNLDRVVAGRIVEHGGAANMLEALLEVGAVRAVPGAQAPETDPPGVLATRRDDEPPAATSRWGWRYHHVGVPTERVRPDECHLEPFGVHVSGFETSPYGVQWMRWDAGSAFPEIVRSVPHVAFEVDDLDAALVGKEVVTPPNRPSRGVRVAMIVDDGCPIELMEFGAEDGSSVPLEARREEEREP